MKKFVVTQSPAGVFISRTAGKRFPKNAIMEEFDTYLEAKAFQDEVQRALQNARMKKSDQWHERFDNAYMRGDIEALSKLCGI